MRLTQPLKWHGGKFYLAKEIIKRFPPHVHYVEPYAGGMAVLFAKPAEWIEGHSEVANDLNGELVNFWHVLKTWPDALIRRLDCTPFSESEFRNATTYREQLTPIGNAANFFVRYRQSRQGLGKDFATLSRTRTRRGMNEQVSSWLTAVEGLPEAHDRLKRVVILNRPALDVIRQQDGPNTFFYLDPPYLHETRVTTGDYEHEMAETQHFDLLKLLNQIEGKFLLSGYPSPMYANAAADNGWHCDEIQIDNKASSKKSKDTKVECLWRNYELSGGER